MPASRSMGKVGAGLALCIMIASVIAPVITMWSRAALAADVDRVEILDTGEFQELPQGVGVRDYGASCPALDVELVQSGATIEAAPMVRFGFTFTARGSGTGGLIPLTVRVRKPRDYGSHGEQTRDILICLDSPAFAGWRCPQNEGIETGVWVVEVLYQGNILASQAFDINPLPDFAMAVPHVEGSQALGELRTHIGPAEHAQGASGADSGGPMGPSTWTMAQGDTGICVQVSACLVPENATNDVAALRAKGYPVFLKVVEDGARGRTWHTVRLGFFPSRDEAERASREFQALENRPAFVVGR